MDGGLDGAQKGVVRELKGGMVELVDESGNVWLKTEDTSGVGMSIFRDDKLVSHVDLTVNDAFRSTFFSDRKGSVWMVAPSAMMHFKEDAGTPGKYAADGTYGLAAEMSANGQYSPLGFYVSPKGHVFSIPSAGTAAK